MAPPLNLPVAAGSPRRTGHPERDAFGLTAEDHAAMDRLDAVRAVYGLDFERELADFEAGRHPLQREAMWP
jgi:hypothetical protein